MTTCAAAGCDNVVVRRPGPGRPAIYCCFACRPTARRSAVVVDVEHPPASVDGRDARRVWIVRLRRGRRSVVVADGLGWPSAAALAGDLEDLLGCRRAEGGALD